LADVSAGTFRIRLAPTGFFPDVLIVPVGAQVAWTNATTQTQALDSGEAYFIFLPVVMRAMGGAAYADTAGSPAVRAAPLDNGHFSATLAPGETFTYTFSITGTFPFYLRAHTQFKGHVLVTQAGLPPDPGGVATTIDPSKVTDIADSTAFLYSGANPIQVGVAPGTIEAKRAGVLRGRVLGQSGTPISGVRVAVLDHPEYGQTLTRLDGMFDLAVNGGGLLTLSYQKDGYLPLQRQQNVPWRDFVELPGVVMLAADAKVGGVDLSSSAMQVVQASVVSDGDGLRQATEKAIPGAAISLTSLDGAYSQTLTTVINPDATAYQGMCFSNVPMGKYNVSGAAPDGYNPTINLTSSVNIYAGDTDYIDFGVQSTPLTVASTPKTKPSPLLGIVGAVFLLAGIGMGIYVWSLL
jgi:plastocyanin